MVEQAVAELPEHFRDQLANLEFTTEDEAGESYGGAGAAGRVLLGVYHGVPLTRRGRGYTMALPDRIVIFQRPIESLARDEDDLRAQVRRVVRHEIAHYFGISDERLREIDAY
jgi:predicted Zn-dependent protease with MMP-like domain